MTLGERKVYQKKWYANLKNNHPEEYRQLRDRQNKVRRDKWRNNPQYRAKVIEYVRIWKKLKEK